MFAETCSILKTLGDAGIVVNAEKLQYCKREVIFAGYKVNCNGFSLDETLFEKVRHFPMPMRKKGIRAWFGLVNQVAHTNKNLTRILEPLKKFLKKESITPIWDMKMIKSFEDSKDIIIEIGRASCRERV